MIIEKGHSLPRVTRIGQTVFKHNISIHLKLYLEQAYLEQSKITNRKSPIITSRGQHTASEPNWNHALQSKVVAYSKIGRCTEKYCNQGAILRFKHLFHDMTLTSALCALKEAAGDLPRRVSHIAIFPSTEQEANT